MVSSSGEYTEYTSTLGRISTYGYATLKYDDAGNEIELKYFTDDDGDGSFTLSSYDKTEWTTIEVSAN